VFVSGMNDTLIGVPTVTVPPNPPVLWIDTRERLLIELETEYTMEKF
jgi:hypothetical protein